MPNGLDRIAKWFEHSMDESFTATNGQYFNPSLERNGRCRQVWSFFAASAHRRPQDLGDCHTQKGGGDKWPVVHILGEQKTLVAAFATHHSHWVHVEQQSSSATLFACHGIKNMSLPKGQIEAL